jgi:hypothetical protein
MLTCLPTPDLHGSGALLEGTTHEIGITRFFPCSFSFRSDTGGENALRRLFSKRLPCFQLARISLIECLFHAVQSQSQVRVDPPYIRRLRQSMQDNWF